MSFESELARGIAVEMEHTSDPVIAERIARDHLAELPDYYTRLVRMEAGALNDTVKTQRVRLLDVFVIGPLMVAGGYALARRGSPVWGTLLGVFGSTTIVYNGRNWLRIRRAS